MGRLAVDIAAFRTDLGHLLTTSYSRYTCLRAIFFFIHSSFFLRTAPFDGVYPTGQEIRPNSADYSIAYRPEVRAPPRPQKRRSHFVRALLRPDTGARIANANISLPVIESVISLAALRVDWGYDVHRVALCRAERLRVSRRGT